MTFNTEDLKAVFSSSAMAQLLPADRADRFFDALFGDPLEGSYDISLAFVSVGAGALEFELQLHQRPGKCLACHLTYGLPEVLARHPVIDIKGIVAGIDTLLDGRARCGQWSLGATEERSPQMHAVPLTIQLKTD